MKIACIFPSNSDNFLYDLVPFLEQKNIDIYINSCDSDVDFIIGWSISQYNSILNIHHSFPNIPLINYNWDCYGWIFEQSRGYPWKEYGELLHDSIESWVPSFCTAGRALEHWKVTNSYRIKTCTKLPLNYDNVEDKSCILNPLRDIPDRQRGWFEQICTELNLPNISSNINLSAEEYKKVLSECSFVVCPWYEASTGGQGLIEGYCLGKPVVVCNSPYMGAQDYFGKLAIYYEPTYESMKEVIKNTWCDTPILDRKECEEFCVANYSPEAMAYEVYLRLKYLYEKYYG
jgi:hypothetical protein